MLTNKPAPIRTLRAAYYAGRYATRGILEPGAARAAAKLTGGLLDAYHLGLRDRGRRYRTETEIICGIAARLRAERDQALGLIGELRRSTLPAA